MSTLKKTFDEVGRPDVIVALGYGPELPVYGRARALWDFYISHFPNLTYIICRTTNELSCGEVYHNGHDLLVGTGRPTHNKSETEHGYSKTGVWSVAENIAQINSQLAVYRYLLRRMNKPFYVCHSTITSVVDFRALFSIIKSLPRSGVFAGMPGRINSPGDYQGMSFVCGTNCLFTSDVIELILDRFDPQSLHNNIPQDANISYMLRDIDRVPLPYFSFVKPRSPATDLDNIGKITRMMLDGGHYHFRVKTTSDQMDLAKREDVDPWIMFEIMRAILGYEAAPNSAIGLKQRLLKSLGTASGVSMAAYEKNFFSEPRDFPLTDEEAETIFPTLQSAT